MVPLGQGRKDERSKRKIVAIKQKSIRPIDQNKDNSS